METIIFFCLVIPILVFVLYLGGNAIMKGMSAKSTNKENQEKEENINPLQDESKISDEIEKLNMLLKDGILTQEEFEKAKKKILDN